MISASAFTVFLPVDSSADEERPATTGAKGSVLGNKEGVFGAVDHFRARLEANTVAFLVLACDPTRV